ncbi:hypothetical protein P7K49_026951 [Saguinus oedipus]|uniref:MYND-type domain-containing protein n=1 Tax=Saguinus oedipus TaxID=9490 RepID=A0ABQ9UFM7_SAGOE|nr:hypothetical protein P7K49_026951 [Saguinus oedipus]
MTELQKAVSEAERKAHDMITTERAKMERTVAEAKRQAAEDALAVINQQEDSSEECAPFNRSSLAEATSAVALVQSCTVIPTSVESVKFGQIGNATNQKGYMPVQQKDHSLMKEIVFLGTKRIADLKQSLRHLQYAVLAFKSFNPSILNIAYLLSLFQDPAGITLKPKPQGSKLHSEHYHTSRSCWNCGRKASETCSGCNTARYCGSFCQHKDWEKHHHICGQTLQAQQQGDTPAVSSSVTPNSGAGSPMDTPPAATPRSTTPGTPSTIETTPR